MGHVPVVFGLVPSLQLAALFTELICRSNSHCTPFVLYVFISISLIIIIVIIIYILFYFLFGAGE